MGYSMKNAPRGNPKTVKPSTDDELVERVMDAMDKATEEWGYPEDAPARAAIALIVEEAVKAVRADFYVKSCCCFDAAATAIRSLNPKER